MSSPPRTVSRLQTLREDRKLSRREVAAWLDISEQQLYRYEHGITPTTRRTLLALASIYEVPVEDLEEAVAA